MSASNLSPSELRSMFGANLRELSSAYPSISDLSRQLGINRTQYNRYLAGESFPRPDILSRICTFFKVDARVLLEPVDQIGSDGTDPIANPFLKDYVGVGAADISEETFPSGFYRFSRRAFTKHSVFLLSIVHIHRDAGNTYMRGFESKLGIRLQNLPEAPGSREFRGIVMQQQEGLVLLVSRRNAMTSSFNYLRRAASYDNNFWVGYVTRTVPEAADGLRATRLVYEYLGPKVSDALSVSRQSGFYNTEELPPLHWGFLQPDKPFS